MIPSSSCNIFSRIQLPIFMLRLTSYGPVFRHLWRGLGRVTDLEVTTQMRTKRSWMILLILLRYWYVKHSSFPHFVTKRLVDVTLTFPTCYYALRRISNVGEQYGYARRSGDPPFHCCGRRFPTIYTSGITPGACAITDPDTTFSRNACYFPATVCTPFVTIQHGNGCSQSADVHH